MNGLWKRSTRRIALSLLRREGIRKAIAEGGDFRVYTNRPTPRVMVGIFLIFFSYVIGWPLIGVLGWLALYVNEPLILIVGGPVAYALSNVVFWIGMLLAGKPYASALMKWLIKSWFEKILGQEIVHSGKSSGRPG